MWAADITYIRMPAVAAICKTRRQQRHEQYLLDHIESSIESDWLPWEAVMTVDCVPSAADVSACAVTMLSPDIAKKLALLVVNVPVNCEPSDIVTAAVASKVPAGALSGIVTLAGESVIAVGVAASTGAVVPASTQLPFCRTYQ